MCRRLLVFFIHLLLHFEIVGQTELQSIERVGRSRHSAKGGYEPLSTYLSVELGRYKGSPPNDDLNRDADGGATDVAIRDSFHEKGPR
jgi:hypothetical protein